MHRCVLLAAVLVLWQVEQAFQTLPADDRGEVDVNSVARMFTASHHPDVRAGRRSESDIVSEFISTFKYRYVVHTSTKFAMIAMLRSYLPFFTHAPSPL